MWLYLLILVMVLGLIRNEGSSLNSGSMLDKILTHNVKRRGFNYLNFMDSNKFPHVGGYYGFMGGFNKKNDKNSGLPRRPLMPADRKTAQQMSNCIPVDTKKKIKSSPQRVEAQDARPPTPPDISKMNPAQIANAEAKNAENQLHNNADPPKQPQDATEGSSPNQQQDKKTDMQNKNEGTPPKIPFMPPMPNIPGIPNPADFINMNGSQLGAMTQGNVMKQLDQMENSQKDMMNQGGKPNSNHPPMHYVGGGVSMTSGGDGVHFMVSQLGGPKQEGNKDQPGKQDGPVQIHLGKLDNPNDPVKIDLGDGKIQQQQKQAATNEQQQKANNQNAPQKAPEIQDKANQNHQVQSTPNNEQSQKNVPGGDVPKQNQQGPINDIPQKQQIQPQNQSPPQNQVAPQNAAPHQNQAAPQNEAPHQNQVVPQNEAPQQNQVAPQNQSPAQNQVAPQNAAPQQNQVAPQNEAPHQNQVAPQNEAPHQNQVAPQNEAPHQNEVAPQNEAPQQNQPSPQNQQNADKMPQIPDFAKISGMLAEATNANVQKQMDSMRKE